MLESPSVLTLKNTFEDHYTTKAGTARYCGHRIVEIEDRTGRLTPKEMLKMYMSAYMDAEHWGGGHAAVGSQNRHIAHRAALVGATLLAGVVGDSVALRRLPIERHSSITSYVVAMF